MQAALIAAVYAVATILTGAISYGFMQVRVAEALTVLPALTPAAIPGLFIGCVIANILGPYGLADMICGSLATLAAAFFSYKLRHRPILVPLPPVIANGIIVGAMLYYVYNVPVSLPVCMGWVALGELISCYVIGYPLLKLLKKHDRLFK